MKRRCSRRRSVWLCAASDGGPFPRSSSSVVHTGNSDWVTLSTLLTYTLEGAAPPPSDTLGAAPSSEEERTSQSCASAQSSGRRRGRTEVATPPEERYITKPCSSSSWEQPGGRSVRRRTGSIDHLFLLARRAVRWHTSAASRASAMYASSPRRASRTHARTARASRSMETCTSSHPDRYPRARASARTASSRATASGDRVDGSGGSVLCRAASFSSRFSFSSFSSIASSSCWGGSSGWSLGWRPRLLHMYSISSFRCCLVRARFCRFFSRPSSSCSASLPISLSVMSSSVSSGAGSLEESRASRFSPSSSFCESSSRASASASSGVSQMYCHSSIPGRQTRVSPWMRTNFQALSSCSSSTGPATRHCPPLSSR
mmetsp:Transcript_25726/g.61084  ORF Transcript_25726/g.61084 Transcript_25726/m.61084 type:complete len:374 (-) Transcript_25726:82-1203(-)